MKYLDLERHYPYVFNIIQKTLHFENDPLPDYLSEIHGLDQLSGILERVKMNHYKDFFEKATYLFSGLVLGHYFSNGNKRLALTSLHYFAEINDYEARKIQRKNHKEMLRGLFPAIRFSKMMQNATVFDNMLYDLTCYVAREETTLNHVTPGVVQYLSSSLRKG